jgi:hypothetical protein
MLKNQDGYDEVLGQGRGLGEQKGARMLDAPVDVTDARNRRSDSARFVVMPATSVLK